MNEFFRVYRKRNILLLIILVILNTGLFMLSFNTEKEITLTGEKLQRYTDGYADYCESIRQSSITMLSLSMYKEGFASDNIRKTAALYENTSPSGAEYGENTGIVLFVQYGLSDIFLLAFTAVIVSDMLTERRKGLDRAVRSTAYGRGRLYIKRVAVLAFSSVSATALLYGGNGAAVILKYGMPDLNRGIQSLPEFMQCPYSITISEYIAAMLSLKVFACFTAAVLFFALLSICGTGAAYIVSAAAAAAGLLMFKLVPAVSSINHLRYINLFTAFRAEKYCCEVFFLNIFGNAVPVIRVLAVFLTVLSAAAVISGYVINSRMYVSENNIFRMITDKVSGLTERLRIQRSLYGWEMYKIMIKQGGLLFMAAAFVLALLSASKYNYVNRTDYRETEWYERYSGEITEESINRAAEDGKKLENQISYFERRIEDLMQYGQNENISGQIAWMTENLEKARSRYEAFTAVYENMTGGYEYTAETGNSVYLIKPYSYELLLQRDTPSKNRASLFILTGITGALSGIFAFEAQSNMKNTLRTSYRGRGRLLASKMAAVFTVCAVLCIAVHMIQFVQIGRFMGYNDTDVPVQSLPFMRDFGLYVSISQYFAVMFASRVILTCAVGAVCALVSRICPDTSSAMGLSVFIMAVPSLLSQTVPGADFVNAVYLIGGAGI